MNDKHNFGFDTECKIFRSNGKVRDIITDIYQPQVEGIIGVDLYSSDGMRKHHEEKPMRSFVKGFIQTHFSNVGAVGGIRLGNNSQSLIVASNYHASIGASTGFAAVTINDTILTNTIAKTTVYQLGTIFQMPTYNAETQTVDVILRKEAQVAAGVTSTVLREVGLHVQDNNAYYLCSRDIISPVTVVAGDILRISITLKFPVSTEKALLHNFYLNLIQLFAVNAFTIYKDTTGANATSIRGSEATSGLTSPDYISVVPAGTATRGIVVGSGNNPVAWDTDYALQTPIASGSSAGQLVANAATLALNATGLVISGTSALMEHWREFQNNSTGNVTVREAGVISYPPTVLFTPQKSFMLARWLTGDVVVRPGETLRVTWRPKVTV